MSSPDYLRRASTGWVFRRAIPSRLRLRFGQTEIVRSLARISQTEAVARARAWGVACEALFMEVAAQPHLSSNAIAAMTAAYLENQDRLFAARLDGLRSSTTRLSQSRKEERELRAEMANEIAVSLREGNTLRFTETFLSKLARDVGLDPALVIGNPQVEDALLLSLARHNETCASALGPPGRHLGFFGRLFDRLIAKSAETDPIERQMENCVLGSEVEAAASTADDTSAKPDPQMLPLEMVPLAAEAAAASDATLEDHLPPLAIFVATKSKPEEKPLWDGRLSTIWPAFTHDVIVTGQFKVSRKAELLSSFRVITWVAGGDLSLIDIRKDDLSRLRQLYCALPKNYKNLRIDKPAGKLMSYSELMKFIEKEKHSRRVFQLVKPKTFNKHNGNLVACYKWAALHRETARPLINKANGMYSHVRKTSKSVKLERAMVPTWALVALFRTPVWMGRANFYHLVRSGTVIVRDSLYWVPLMETANGLRREECCQLRVRHFILRFGIWCIDLTAADLNVKVEDGASPRLVPLQKELLAAGILEALIFGRNPDDLVFTDVNNNNALAAYGKKCGERFLNYAKNVVPDFAFLDQEFLGSLPSSIGLDKEAALTEFRLSKTQEFRDKMNNHGIRHWWKTTAENMKCKTLFINDLLGHAGSEEGEGGRYFKYSYVTNLKETVDAVEMPFDGKMLRLAYEQSLVGKSV